MAWIDAKSIDTVRIEEVGASRAVSMTGSQWIDFRDRCLKAEEERDAALAEVIRQTKRLGDVLKVATKGRLRAAEAINGPGTADPGTCPYATSPHESFVYWRGYREGLLPVLIAWEGKDHT